MVQLTCTMIQLANLSQILGATAKKLVVQAIGPMVQLLLTFS